MGKLRKISPALAAVLLAGLGVAVRLLATRSNLLYESDMHTFQAWAAMLYENGFSAFYGQGFTDYPPLYMYVLYALGGLRALLGLDFLSPAFNLLTKTPAMLCDVALGLGLFYVALPKAGFRVAALLSAAWMLNPAVIIDSAVWGQVDSFYTLLLFISLWYLTEKKPLPAYLWFGAAILTKPQSLFLGPIYLYHAFAYLKEQRFAAPAIGRLAARIGAALAFMLLLSLPFTTSFDFSPIINQYITTIDSYPYATINAYNFFALVGGNWRPLTETFLGVAYSLWGLVFLAAIVVASWFALRKDKDGSRIYFAAAGLTILVFVFSIKMHERYLFPALFFLILAHAKEKKPRLLWLYGGFSVTFFVNCLDILRGVNSNLSFLSLLNIVLAGLTVYAYCLSFRKKVPSRRTRP